MSSGDEGAHVPGPAAAAQAAPPEPRGQCRAAAFGNFEEFKDEDNWTEYLERLDNYFDAYHITDKAEKGLSS